MTKFKKNVRKLMRLEYKKTFNDGIINSWINTLNRCLENGYIGWSASSCPCLRHRIEAGSLLCLSKKKPKYKGDLEWCDNHCKRAKIYKKIANAMHLDMTLIPYFIEQLKTLL